MRKRIKKWFIKLLAERFGEDILDYWSDMEHQKHWYKARRHGYKKSEMGFYYSDIADNANNNLSRYLQ